jgi:hypothetical protein
MIGSFIERYSAKVCMGSPGGSSGGGRDVGVQTVNTKDKVNRDGSKNLSFSEAVAHMLSNSGVTGKVGTSGIEVGIAPTCGSCHDPVGKSKKR